MYAGFISAEIEQSSMNFSVRLSSIDTVTQVENGSGTMSAKKKNFTETLMNECRPTGKIWAKYRCQWSCNSKCFTQSIATEPEPGTSVKDAFTIPSSSARYGMKRTKNVQLPILMVALI